MLGVTISYHQLEQFLIKELHVEWVHKPFLDHLHLKAYLDKAHRQGEIELFGESYSPSDIEELSKEKEGRIFEFKFSPGPCEGYMLLLKMESGQIFYIKTFDRNTFELFLSWVNQLEACYRDKPRRRIYEPIPVGSIVYVVDNNPAGTQIIPHRVELREPTEESSYPLCLKDVNPVTHGVHYLEDGWERWPHVFFRIEDAISYLEGEEKLSVNVKS
ncbi:hypothetical protein EHV15_35845 [Paenibacillus oralis]|uniref:Uncharacterized protein n=1 Tax=Paenibacillus oralis TaxID=2490856 RepID=A0A3P3TA80_9BACL|nr:hypothetical protein [Paenibacillus oralis]RRJ54946.1 hypothetical protein EHV15_35845 [Paenibacillus oralis]